MDTNYSDWPSVMSPPPGFVVRGCGRAFLLAAGRDVTAVELFAWCTQAARSNGVSSPSFIRARNWRDDAYNFALPHPWFHS
jgi:hypothetical protein